MEPDDESPRKVTRADAFPLAPRRLFPEPAVAPTPESDGAGSALKSFLASAFVGTGAFVVLASQTFTHTSGAQRSVRLERRQIQAAAQAELRAAEEAS
jgi:curli biogenesis system outer membrane secretion channel CsgG